MFYDSTLQDKYCVNTINYITISNKVLCRSQITSFSTFILSQNEWQTTSIWQMNAINNEFRIVDKDIFAAQSKICIKFWRRSSSPECGVLSFVHVKRFFLYATVILRVFEEGPVCAHLLEVIYRQQIKVCKLARGKICHQQLCVL